MISDSTIIRYEKIALRLAQQLLEAGGITSPSPAELAEARAVVLSACAAAGDYLIARFGYSDALLDAFNAAVADVNVLLRIARQAGWSGDRTHRIRLWQSQPLDPQTWHLSQNLHAIY
jgi:hypothetical protein